MALLGFEGFDHHGSPGSNVSPDLSLKPGWTASATNMQKVAGLLGGFQFVGASTASSATYTPGSSYSTLIMGQRHRSRNTSFPPAAVSDIFKFMDGATAQVGLSYDTTGHLLLWRGTNATVLATGTTVLTAGAYYYIELKVTFHNTAGAYELRINGVTEFSASSVNTRNSANNSATAALLNWYAGESSSIGIGVDDFYLCDDTTGVNNNFLGISRVETLFPTANDSVTWTPLSSTNVSQIQEVSVDDDTSYNSTTGTGNVDTFTHGSLSSTPVTIFGVQITAKMRKDDVSNQTARTKLISGATTQNGATNTLSTTYSRPTDQYIDDPNTSAAWTAAAVNATKIGYEKVT